MVIKINKLKSQNSLTQKANKEESEHEEQLIENGDDVSIAETPSEDKKYENCSEKTKNNSNLKTKKKEIESRTSRNKCLQMQEKSHENSTSSTENYRQSWFNVNSQPFKVNIEVDAAAVLILFISMFTRMWRLDEPRGIVFDELHYGKFASLYMRQTFFFDTHPPLGKQLIALAGYIANFDGNVQFDRIGGDYPDSVPIRSLRAVPAFFGSLLAPTIYYLIVEMGMTHRTAILAGFLIILENSLLTQSRFVLMESMLIWFSVFGIFAFLKFRKESHKPFGIRWWAWLFSCSISLTCALCIKYIGIFSASLAVSLLTLDYWKMISDATLCAKQLIVHLITRIFAIVVIPVCIYLLVFFVHLSLLTKAGPHDNIMTSGFQASLEGGLASITKGQPLEVVHGSQITLRHTHGRACWLHSHPHVYPLRYPDKRGSSHQQQVSCYSFKDVNNWWIVKRPEINDLVVSEPLDRIKHGETIQLFHGMTSRTLNSHDVAAPMSPQHQEVSCYIDYNISFPAQNLWKVDIVNRDTEGDVWHTIHSHVRFIHVPSGQALKFSSKQLPDWGFHQHEVVTDRLLNQDDTIWNVEEHRHTKNADQKEREREMGMAEFVPLQPTQLSFFEKLWELQYKMFITNNENVQDHMYSSDALDWPFLTRGIAYWVSPYSNAQIHLLGNIVTWYTATAGIMLYVTILVFYLLRRRRGYFDIPEDIWSKFCDAGQVGLSGYLLHFLPYFFVDRTLFLHHYLPAYLFKIILLVSLLEHVDFLIGFIEKPLLRKLFYMSIVVWVSTVIYTFIKLSVFSYGTTPLAVDEILNLKWKDTWDFIIHRV